MGESTTVHDLFASSRAPRFDRARRAAVFSRTLRRDHACRKPFPCETLNSIPISLSSLRYLSRLSPQAPSHRWQAEALAQEAEVRTPPCRDFPRSRRALKPANGRRCSPCDLGFFLLETIAHRPLPSLSSIPSLQVRVGPPVRQHQDLFLGLRPHRAMPRRQQEVPRDPSRLW